MVWTKSVMAVALGLGLGGCSGIGTRQAYDPWPDFARQGYAARELAAADFTLRGALRDDDPAATLHVYIEGDGRAWLGRTRPSPDPTPQQPVGAELALEDPAAAVLYLARPCQWRPETAAGTCDRHLWTTGRYAEGVVAGYVEILEQVRKSRQNGRLALIGYSGGGAIAALLAARMSEVDWLLTVAANLDTARWTTLHQVSALSASLNPAESADRARAIPQRHFVGALDTIVPLAVVAGYAERGAGPASVQQLPGADHHCCWKSLWAGLLSEWEAKLKGQQAASRRP